MKMRARFVMPVARCVFKNYVYKVRHGLAKGLKRRGGFGFLHKSSLNKEESFLMGLDLSGQIVYDIGGWEGIITIFLARAVGEGGRVITFEPNPECQARILNNVRLNQFQNVQVQKVGLGRQADKGTLVYSSQSMGVGSLQEDIKAHLLAEKGATAIQVDIDTLDHQISSYHLPEPDFIKIDVEGLELDVLLGMINTITRCKPRLFIEIHGADVPKKIENARNLVSYLSQYGYSILHVESGEQIVPANAQIAKEGHLYCA
jgi:FkbM family methyltransferase